jgi:hypothetical protein
MSPLLNLSTKLSLTPKSKVLLSIFSQFCNLFSILWRFKYRFFPGSQENSIFLAVVFGYLPKNLQLLSQLKLPEIEVKNFQ